MAEKLLMLAAFALLLSGCSPSGGLEGRWRGFAEAFVPRQGPEAWAGDSALASAALRPREGETLDLNPDGSCLRSLPGQRAAGRWSVSGDTLRLIYAGGQADDWLFKRLSDDTLALSRPASPSIVRLYGRTQK